ncbi:T9SS type A sorting domain-containing protein [bacterium]|nr:T9SS type A sorting domain-containing protein [bacterium]
MSRPIKLGIVFFWVLVVLLPGAASAQDSLALQPQDHLYNFTYMPTEKSIAVSGDHLYVGLESPWQGPSMLVVDTRTNPAQVVTTLPLEEAVNDLTNFGNYLLSTSDQAIRIYGTHNSNNLNLLSSYSGHEGMRFLSSWVSGTTIISLVDHPASQTYDLLLISMDDFSSPQLLTEMPVDGLPRGLSIVENLLIFEIDDETSILDITDPANPLQLGTVESDNPGHSILLAAGIGLDGVNLYYHIERTNELDQILTLEVANPEAPDTIGSAQVTRDLLPSLPSRLLDDILFVPTSLGMTDMYQLQGNENPSFVGSLQGLLNEIVDSNYGFFLTNHLESPIRRYNLSSPSSPIEFAPIEGRELRPLAFDPSRNLLFLHDGELLRTVAVHQQLDGWFEELNASPIEIRQQVCVSGNRLYHWTSGDTIFVINTNNPAIPSEMSPWMPRVPVFPGDLFPASEGDRLVKIEPSGEIHVYSSFTHPPQPVATLRIIGEPPPLSVALRGDILAVLLPQSELRLYDIVNPFGPQLLSTLILPFVDLNRVSWKNEYILVRSRDVLLKVDPSDEANPFLAGDMPLPYHGECWSGPGWVSVESRGISTFFDTDATFPAPHTSLLFGEDGSPFSGTRDHIITISAHTISLYQLQRLQAGFGDGSSSIPSSFTIEKVYPNPFNGQATVVLTIPQDGLLTLSLFDLLGREVTRQERRQLAGRFVLPLQLEQLSSGTYFLRASDTKGASATQRITLVR